ncbi:MAG: RNA polymerase sigma factor [Bacteroidota bacterium]|nr:RNA polymerase sigma factor [Bacteroidota bacterium]
MVERAIQGDQMASRQLYDQFAKPMFNLCYRILNNEGDARDVLQESFIKIFQNLHQLQKEELLPAWIKRICTNTALQHFEKRNRIRFDELDLNTQFISSEDYELELNEKEFEFQIDQLKAAIQKLPDRYRIVFTMYAIEDFSHEEIAKMLGIVSSTSRSQYLRAKQKILEILKKNNSDVRSIKKIYSEAQGSLG